MRTSKIILLLSAIFILAITPLAYARGGGGGHGGGGGYHRGYGGGGYRGGGYYGGGYRGYGYRGYYGGYRGWGWGWGWWGWGWPYYSPYGSGWPYYSSSYPYSGSSGFGLGQPPQPEQQQPYYWYYCQDPQGYYPYVKSCPGGWMQVVPPAAPPNVTPPNE